MKAFFPQESRIRCFPKHDYHTLHDGTFICYFQQHDPIVESKGKATLRATMETRDMIDVIKECDGCRAFYKRIDKEDKQPLLTSCEIQVRSYPVHPVPLLRSLLSYAAYTMTYTAYPAPYILTYIPTCPANPSLCHISLSSCSSSIWGAK
jgi:hypothetical protein